MRKNYISAVLLICFALKLQAQTPSINEAQRVSYFSDSYTKKIDDKVETLKAKNDALDAEAKNEKDINKIAAITAEKQVNTDLINALQIYGNVDAKKDYSELFNKLINQKRDTINNVYAQGLKSDKLTLGQIDSIYNLIAKKRKEIAALEIERDETVAAFGKFPWFFPSWKKINRKKFFHDMYSNKTDKTILLNSFALNANSDASAVQTEVVTDNMWALRVSFGSVLSISNSKSADTQEAPDEQTKKKTEQEAFSRLINGGGNFYLDVILPVFTTNQNNGDQITFYGYANLRGAMDLEGFSSNVNTSTGNGTAGLNAYLGISSDNKKFNFFLQGNANYTVGTNEFYNNLGLNNEKPFLNGKIIAGVTMLNQFRISAIVNAFGSDEKIRSSKVVVGVQVLPGF
ncbi:hypothetical protein DM790_13335 [Flavobacterium collinsii]|uniref:hypothetical protein n=1 Tax=Flavobacterium sp. YJ01 TaxID=3031997 RepID=UPI0015C164C8|nr:hypothetical protein [Flavobacterium sp. YJ01]NWL01804.1 hypothetical protein [Flavobacterium collinsii]WET02950.1 hypothetical protein P0R33_01195 [Flavobacterium sp. YJ01]